MISRSYKTVKYFSKVSTLNTTINGMETPQLKRNKLAFGRRLQELREERNLSLLQVSYNCNIDDSKISKIEHGKINITLGTLIELARGLGVHPKELLDVEFE